MGHAYDKNGKLNDAVKQYQESCGIYQMKKGKECMECGEILVSLGDALAKSTHYQEAITAYVNSLAVV